MVVERYSLQKLNEGKVEEQYEVIVTNNFVALEDLEDNADISV
jgi:hypothetical protein